MRTYELTSLACTILNRITRLFPRFNVVFLNVWLLLGKLNSCFHFIVSYRVVIINSICSCRDNGDAQNLLAKEFGIDGRNFFYSVKQLESRGLIVRQPAIVRTKEVDSKTTSCITTNMIYLTRYAKPMGSQQRFEICKEDSVSEHETTAAGEDTLINDFLPAMQEVCDKLEKANDKVSKLEALLFIKMDLA